jgi:hypothetical protein
MKNIKNILTVIGAGLLTLYFFSCEVGLGTMINMNGPVVSISSPVLEEDLNDIMVSTVFVITGTAQSASNITRMEIKMDFYDRQKRETVRMGREWRYQGGVWQYKQDNNIPWRNYTPEDFYDEDEDFSEELFWIKSGDIVNWSIPITLERMDTGDFFIHVSAWDSAGNHDSNSSVTIRVFFNNKEPQFNIDSPARPQLLSGVIGADGQFNLDIPQELKDYIYNPIGNPIGTRNNIDNWITDKPWTIRWRIDDEAVPPLDLIIEFTGKHDLDNNEDRTVYYRQEVTLTTKSGEINIIDIDPENKLPRDEPTYMQIVTTLTDQVGNRQYKSQGFFAYLPDAEKPWHTMTFAFVPDPNAPSAIKPNDYPNQMFLLRNTGSRGNPVYGRNNLESISWNLYRLKDDSLERIADEQWAGTSTFNGLSRNTSWDFEVITAFGTGRFEIEVTATDINGNSGVYTGYFNIESNATPRVKEMNLQEPFFGNSIGNVQIKGIAEIEGPQTSVTINRAALAWIMPNAPDATSAQLLYTDRTFINWENASPAGWHDTVNGVMVWSIDAQDIVFEKTNDDDLDEYEFTRTLNLFSDLGIGINGNPLNQKTFIVRVISNEHSLEAPRASTFSFSTIGDTNDPELKITRLHVQKYNQITGDPLPLQTIDWPLGSMLDIMNEGDELWFEGTWDDDSRRAWYGLTEPDLRSRFGNMTVTWVGENVFEIPIAQFTANPGGPNGVWVTQRHKFPEDNREPIVDIDVSLADLSGNRATITETMTIETDNPSLVRISSITSDGIYGENKITQVGETVFRPIYIDLEFNKPVMFVHDENSITPANAPRLLLNNGGMAFYMSGNNTSRLHFVYYVDGNGAGHSPFAVNGEGGGSFNGRLNVTEIVSPHFPVAQWVSADGGTAVNIPLNVFYPGSPISLAGSKNIVIDKAPPVIDSFTSTTSALRPHGIGSSININVNFDKTVVVRGATQANLYLELSGITGGTAVAGFTNVAGADSISFTYTVIDGFNTAGLNVGITRLVMGAGVSIIDEAENVFDPPVTSNAVINNTAGTPAGLSVRTEVPAPPSIDITAGTYYNDALMFRIGNLLTNLGSSVEYALNFRGAQTVWTTVTQNIQGASPGSYFVDIPLNINGSYQIAARQYDNANPRNRSLPEVVGGDVVLDIGNLLERITSSTPDGIYGTTAVINIDLVFRKPVYIQGSYTANSAYLTLACENNPAVTTRAYLLNNTSHSNNNRTWTFQYEVQNTDLFDRLDVTEINLAAVNFYDAATGGTRINDWIQLNAANGVTGVHPDNRLARQKSLKILTGNPAIVDQTLVVSPANGDIVYNPAANTLTFTFNRDIFRGDTTQKVIVRQIDEAEAAYRIPAVLSVDRWNEIFIGRSDLNSFIPAPPAGITTEADYWRWIGEQLYPLGTNGANASFVSDTTIKRVLRYEVDTTVDDFPASISSIANMLDFETVKTIFRQAEALYFDVNDREVTITGRNLTIALSGARGLPVRGATYEVIFPNGYVKDFLENHNGGSLIGNYVTQDNLPASGLEPPVIRINKGQDQETITGDGYNRQAVQPLTSTVKIDSRTPNAAVTYRTRQTTDNVGRFIWRENPNWFVHPDTFEQVGVTNNHVNDANAAIAPRVISHRLPNLGSQRTGEYGSFNATRDRPQSGQSSNGDTDLYTGVLWTNGYNWWLPMGTMPTTGGTAGQNNGFNTYTPNFPIGSNNYNDGGMIIHIEARTNGNASVVSYESAYRSVLVFNNVAINSNPFNAPDTAIGASREGAFPIPELGRLWIRGGDTSSGNPTIPDFPLSRDRSQHRKVRLLTPIQVNVVAGGDAGVNNNSTIGNTGSTVPFGTLENARNAVITDAHRPNTYDSDGSYLWFWVTWKLNVNAYIDILAGDLPEDDDEDVPQVPQSQRDMYYSYIMAKEHFPVIPGRTTVLGTGVFWTNYVDGGHGTLGFGSVMSVPPATDLENN